MSKFYYNENQSSFDAIVVGSGISGGWATKELCERGLKTLLLERGRMIKHIEDYTTAHMDPWDIENNGTPTPAQLERQHKQKRTGYTVSRYHSHFFVDDIDHPYNEEEGCRFDWMRGYHVGGRSLQWGRQSYRWSDIAFEANKKDGVGVDWPVRYKDIEPWYTKVEEHIGVSGEALGLEQLPDSKFLPMMELNSPEKALRKAAMEKLGITITAGRTAHITGDKQFEGRTKCQFRNRCMRGCPFGGYFSSQSSTLPAAVKTGNLTLRVDSIVSEVLYDEKTGKASGVKIIDRETKEEIVYEAKVVFLCASAIASAAILLNSKSERFPNGLGNDSDQLGRNIMDHHLGVGAGGVIEGYEDEYYKGRRPNGIYIPQFQNLPGDKKKRTYLRGFGYQGGASRSNYQSIIAEYAYGKELKDAILKPGQWSIGIGGFGEILPHPENRMYLDYDKKDQWGLPTVTFTTKFRENEYKMREEMKSAAVEILEAAGVKNVRGYDNPNSHGIGLGIHEMGTARMGHDPKTSVVNKYNQVHTCKNVFMTDGAFMTSANCVNPSLTYMAFSARAANYAADQIEKGLL